LTPDLSDVPVQLRDAASGGLRLRLKGHEGKVNCLAFSPDGKRIVTGSYDKTAKVWDAATGVVLWIVLSIAFAFYIKNFSSYGAAYGAFGAAIVLLLWLYVSANAFLFGAELNAELERSEKAGRRGPPPPGEPGLRHPRG